MRLRKKNSSNWRTHLCVLFILKKIILSYSVQPNVVPSKLKPSYISLLTMSSISAQTGTTELNNDQVATAIVSESSTQVDTCNNSIDASGPPLLDLSSPMNQVEGDTNEVMTRDEPNSLPTSNQRSQDQRVPTYDSGEPIRLPGTYPPEWLPDTEADSCMTCDSPFTLIKRRHHCRACGKIFCGECCKFRAKLLYLDNKEARVCSNCLSLIRTLFLANTTAQNCGIDAPVTNQNAAPEPTPSGSQQPTQSTNATRVHGVLKTSNNQSRTDLGESSTGLDSHTNKQVMFSDGIRPGTDLSEQNPIPSSSAASSTTSTNPATYSLLGRQSRLDRREPHKRGKGTKSHENSYRNIAVCDELGYLPPIVITKNTQINFDPDVAGSSGSSSSMSSILLGRKKSTQVSQEASSLNGLVKFEEFLGLVGSESVITFMLLRNFYLKAKIVRKGCCIDVVSHQATNLKEVSLTGNTETELVDCPEYWCFASEGLDKFGQNEILLVIDKDKQDTCIPRDVFTIYLTLHELALRRQPLENLGNLLFQDGLFGFRDTAGLLLVKSMPDHCLENLVLPKRPFLVALLLQRWEVPWSKVFPMRLLLRLGYEYKVYPYPITSFRTREPVYYEVGHTIISILGDFRNFRYSITHVNGLNVSINKSTKKVIVRLDQENYNQFNKVLDSSNNEHVLAWSSCPILEADGHLVSTQNDDGQHETVEFMKRKTNPPDSVLGASFIIFSGALKVSQTGQPAKISIVEDGLLIQIQSCTMSALKNAIQFMHHFDIDCENTQDVLNRVELEWRPSNAQTCAQ